MASAFLALRTASLRHFSSYSSCISNRGTILVASVSCFLIGFQRQTQCAGRAAPPPRFGMSVRYKSNNTSNTSIPPIEVSKDKEEDCPLCRKYSQGPCGDTFKKWLACTDKHKGIDPSTQEEEHLDKCSHLAEPLAKCLEIHQEFYDNLNIYDDAEEETTLMTEWTGVVTEVEETSTTQEFPPVLMPDLQIRPSNRTGMAAFCYNSGKNGNVPLILAYVKDTDSGKLLAAGSREDLWEWQDKYGVLRLSIPSTTLSITAYALYDNVLYSTTLLVPKQHDA